MVSKLLGLLLKFMIYPQNKFHIHTISYSQIIRSKKPKFIISPKFIVRSNWSCSTVFFSSSIFYWNYNNKYWYIFV